MVSCRPFTTSLVGASSSIENQHNHMRTASYHLLDCRIYSVKPNTGYSAGYHHAYCISYKKKFLGKNMAIIHNLPLHLFVFHNILQQIQIQKKIIFLTAKCKCNTFYLWGKMLPYRQYKMRHAIWKKSDHAVLATGKN